MILVVIITRSLQVPAWARDGFPASPAPVAPTRLIIETIRRVYIFEACMHILNSQGGINTTNTRTATPRVYQARFGDGEGVVPPGRHVVHFLAAEHEPRHAHIVGAHPVAQLRTAKNRRVYF
jgi:hypothetical protein